MPLNHCFTFGTCRRCKGKLYLCVSHDMEDGAGSWCSACGSRWMLTSAQTVQKTDIAAHDLAKATGRRMAYEGRLHPDATITWRANAAVLSRAEAERMKESLAHLVGRARDLEERLRGYHLWSFRVQDGRLVARHRDADLLLVQYTAGARKKGRSPHACSACHKAIPAGAKGYKIEREITRTYGSWSRDRICSACPADAKETPKPALRVIDGGKAEREVG